MASVLLILSMGLSFLLPIDFIEILLVYVVATFFYSVYLKRVLLVDVVLLAVLFTIRVLAGGAATNIDVSYWLFTFSLFLFLSVAIIKRYTELRSSDLPNDQSLPGRAYQIRDQGLLQSIGVAAGMVAVLTLALYANSGNVRQLYAHPNLIWLLCPLVLYWIGRLWFLSERDLMIDDPVLFSVKDKITYLTAGLTIVLLWIAA